MRSNRFLSVGEVKVPDPGGDFWARRRSSVFSFFLCRKGSTIGGVVGKVKVLEATMLHMNKRRDKGIETVFFDILLDGAC